MTKLRLTYLWAKLKALVTRQPTDDATRTFVPLTVAVGRFGNGGLGLVFDVGDRDMVVLLPRANAVRLVDTMLDALGLEEEKDEPEPRAS